ncbi:MAG: hypothetical protein AMXMBFR53_36630 [Gemmatimonadota bacterium]
MTTTSQRWADAQNRVELMGARDLQVPQGFPIRLPDPDDYAPDTLERLVALRLREMAAGPERDEGHRRLARLDSAYEDASEWLDDVGHPTEEQGGLFDVWDFDDEQAIHEKEVA